ncbi:MAG: bifunctional phosphoribosylaminoimidazolecarboxamide formyltransferase/IMP cyclohydrolase PurH [Pelagibacteraceae bacterium]|nr:bifunctional phosphoribosylaminoimidazolecarboxamide formyltransferase/IMP cyclohydrolase PurH [Pelagibacteraceae bacterium]
MFKYRNVLISVYDKTNLDKLAKFLIKKKFTIYSTGGTSIYLNKINIPFKEISKYTKQKEILDGRVKTLHPKIFGGLLANPKGKHQKELIKNKIINFDLLIVNLYPFEETLKKTKSHQKIIDMIDIGGHSLIRASIKNYSKITTIIDPSDYIKFETSFNSITKNKKKLAIKALEYANKYDQKIIDWLNGEEKNKYELRYGENPHQAAQARIYDKAFKQISGNKGLSYNNLLDLDAAIRIVFGYQKNKNNIAAIVKHNTPCGYAIHQNQKIAFQNALAGDPISAFGGIIVLNNKLSSLTAKLISKGFYEVVAAPSFENDAITILSAKKNLRIVKINPKIPKYESKSIFAGTLHQETNNFKIVTKKITGKEIKKNLNINFYIHVLKFVRSNAIAIFDNNKLLSQCGGQTSRVDSLKFAIEKLKKLPKNKLKEHLYLISDAFFPFEDSLKLIIKSKLNITIFTPLGSINDIKIISFAKKNKLNLYEINHRHFKH